MICQTCRDAADLFTAIKNAPRPSNIEEAIDTIIAGAFKDRVIKLHAECKGSSWCDCQHSTKITEWGLQWEHREPSTTPREPASSMT